MLAIDNDKNIRYSPTLGRRDNPHDQNCLTQKILFTNLQALRHQIKQAETLIKERSIAAEAKWAVEYSSPPARGTQSTRNVNLVLSILEELDGYVFERTDASNCLESLYGRLFGAPAAAAASAEAVNDDVLIHTLCEWAVTSKRSGEHRAFVVAKLLEMRQVQLSPNGEFHIQQLFLTLPDEINLKIYLIFGVILL